MKRLKPSKLLVNLALLIAALLWLLPVYWMVNSAFQEERNLLASPPNLLPSPPTLANFRGVLHDGSFWQAMGMSLTVAVITVVVTTVAALLAAVALVRFNFLGRRTLVVLVLVIQMIPAEALFISQYRMLDSWALLNSIAGLSLLYIGGVLPFVIWMMRGFIVGVPQELEQAAMVDGCTHTQAFIRITLPLLAPGLVSTSVFAFLHSWNEYTLALIVLSRDSAYTLPLWLQSFQQGLRGADWGGVMAGSTLIALPVMLIFAFVQTRMTAGLVDGAVKG
ncbi:MAG: carbohydrate ABC transporter permease [Mobiluncus porci]|uniref:Carbohydrate ABC transporter permease n=1 Tax=Mobiluncus porci TaxID=2652278 RepID=A0A7K0K2N0_9ACTO|nr:MULTISPECIES: carbohydrate ABC transporter permease [Mobiluncus]MCI6585413.1 carbohydrate ABC transporter permease [Mobiluncus sp.]MDD7541377.1 carbohydrate ABC transporter permease [Mobiluncus porci]MDY5747860.1 carbohydrate ABC transporter permease [Mobiluncus porci]MST49741.1 carbohydrate ABC transporter permease [Mobiluncus porci]